MEVRLSLIHIYKDLQPPRLAAPVAMMHLRRLQAAARQAQAVAVDGELQGAGKIQPQRAVGGDVKGQLHRGEGQSLPAPALGFPAPVSYTHLVA